MRLARHPLVRRGVPLLGLAVGALVAAGCDAKPNPRESASAPVETTPPPPEGLIAEATIATPDATWQRLQRGLAAGTGLLPTTLGGLVCALAGLDARLEPEISGTSPVYVVVAGDPAAPSWVVAGHLVEERRVRPLFDGKTAIFEPRDAGSLVLLAPKGAPAAGARGGGDVVAVAAIAPGGWLVVGSSPAALGDLAPYATRNLARNPVAEEAIAIDVAAAALRGSVAAAIARRWGDVEKAMLDDDRKLRDAHGGRAPDFGDPRAIVGALDGWVQTKINALRDLGGAHLAIDVGADHVRAVLTASPASPDGAAAALVASLHGGDLTPLAASPRETILALLNRSDGAARAADAADLEAGLLKTLGPRLGAADTKRVHGAIDDWSSARGDWATLALTLSPSARGAIADVASNDPARSARAVREALDLFAQVRAIHDPVGAWLHARGVTFSTPALGAGRAAMATFATDERNPISLAWTATALEASAPTATAAPPGHIQLALGAAPLPLLAASSPGATLDDDPAIHAALSAVGPVAGAIVLQPRALPGCSASGAIVLAWSARPDAQEKAALWGTLEASDSALRCVAKSLF